MRIAIDLTATRTRSTTIYYNSILPELLEQSRKDDFLIFISPGNREFYNNKEEREIVYKKVKFAKKAMLRIVWEQLFLPIHLIAWKADVLLSPWDITAACSPCQVVLGVHNPHSTVLDKYEFPLRQKIKNLLRLILTRLSVRKASIIYFPTEVISKEFITKFKIPEERIHIVNHGTDISMWERTDDADITLKKYGIEDSPYFLFASMLYQFKHPDDLVLAFSKIAKKDASKDMLLVFAGDIPDKHFEREIVALVESEGLKSRVRFLGLVPYDEMPALYQNAISVIMPTSKESFGLPYIEAMASGAPLICADVPVAREVCGSACIYYEVRKTTALANKMEEMANKEGRDEIIRLEKEQASNYSWKREASETLELIHVVKR